MIFEILGRKSGNVRHSWKEKSGFSIKRAKGLPCYTFWHFQTEVKLLTKDGIVTAAPGACYLCSPGVPQYFESAQELKHDWMHLDAEAAQVWSRCGLDFDRLYYPAEPAFVTGLVRRIEEEYFARAEMSGEMLGALIWQLFIRIGRACRPEPPVADGPDYQRLRDFRREMFRRIGEDWTVEKMAQAVNMSQPTFFTRYREYFRCSPIQDLLRERVQMARVQLQYSDLPVAEIASRLGYHDATHFSRQFRSMTGDCPSVYRKMNR